MHGNGLGILLFLENNYVLAGLLFEPFVFAFQEFISQLLSRIQGMRKLNAPQKKDL